MIKKIPVVEIFYSVQGEGALIGKLSYFIRTGGCSMRCEWCDSMHAVDPEQIKRNAERLTPAEITERIFSMHHKIATSPKEAKPWITLTGGDPVMWPLGEMIMHMRFAGFKLAVETQGSLYKDWLGVCDLVTLSPKPPSSRMPESKELERYVANLGKYLVFKVVVFDKQDLAFAEDLHVRYPHVPFYITSGTPQNYIDGELLGGEVLEGCRNLIEDVLRRPKLQDVTILPQMHVLLWGRELAR